MTESAQGSSPTPVHGATPDRSHAPSVVVVVALVGLLSTVGASALGGYWANRSVQRQFESQRSAEFQDQRRQVYVDYLTATTQACDAQNGSDTAKADKTAIDVLNQQGRVLLIGGPQLRDSVSKFTQAIVFEDDPKKQACGDKAKYLALRNAFVESARRDLE
jgi:type II secretory pathway pseudopilin PulG